MLIRNAIGFLTGISGKTGFFFRTPKAGQQGNARSKDYLEELKADKTSIIEGTLAVFALLLSILVAEKGVWFLSLSLLGFGGLTLKSMGLSRLLRNSDRARIRSA